MSDEFSSVARQELQAELDALYQIAIHCTNDEHIFRNSDGIEKHLHKIKGLSPMMGQKKIGEVAKTADIVMRYIIDHGSVAGSHMFILETIESMKQIFSGQRSFNIVDFRKMAHEKFPQVSTW